MPVKKFLSQNKINNNFLSLLSLCSHSYFLELSPALLLSTNTILMKLISTDVEFRFRVEVRVGGQLKVIGKI